MSYQVLARKWRPHTLADMVGQEPTRRMLTNALLQNRIHHAYLFTGTRGVGKTTLARIFAKCLNCESGITPTPCEQCHACLSINAGQFLDLYEIDAASRTKVEDTRELLDNVPYAPTQGRYKIYLIDEVHMLSNHSFNALLKTLEEPPAHVKFLLATTEPKRLPITILSRCLQFHLTRIPLEQITTQLQTICAAEHIAYDNIALEKLAIAAEGSLRDALSLLDQAIAYCQGEVRIADLHTMLGTLTQQDLLPLLQALANKDAATLFQLIAQLTEHTPDFSQVLNECLDLFHQIAVTQMVANQNTDNQPIQQLAQQFTPKEVRYYYQAALLGKRDLAYSTTPQQAFEMSFLQMLAFHQTQTTTVSAAENTAEEIACYPLLDSNILDSKDSNIAVDPIAMKTHYVWRDILPQLKLQGMAYALAVNCALKHKQENKIELTLSTHHQPMLNPKLKERLTEALSQYFNEPIQLDITLTTDEFMTPAKQQQKEQAEQITQATQTLLQQPEVKAFLDMYDATLEVSPL